MKICYRKTNGRASDVRFVDKDYQAQAGELLTDGTRLPTAAELSDPPAAAEVALQTISTIERDNPITHRAIRELILALGEINPAGKSTPFYRRVLAVEQAIAAERVKL